MAFNRRMCHKLAPDNLRSGGHRPTAVRRAGASRLPRTRRRRGHSPPTARASVGDATTEAGGTPFFFFFRLASDVPRRTRLTARPSWRPRRQAPPR
eukprot:scaffold1204_cov407-Prasinococcus_capsulatus_cf.AAC.14